MSLEKFTDSDLESFENSFYTCPGKDISEDSSEDSIKYLSEELISDPDSDLEELNKPSLDESYLDESYLDESYLDESYLDESYLDEWLEAAKIFDKSEYHFQRCIDPDWIKINPRIQAAYVNMEGEKCKLCSKDNTSFKVIVNIAKNLCSNKRLKFLEKFLENSKESNKSILDEFYQDRIVISSNCQLISVDNLYNEFLSWKKDSRINREILKEYFENKWGASMKEIWYRDCYLRQPV